jgi:hypothetical protein
VILLKKIKDAAKFGQHARSSYWNPLYVVINFVNGIAQTPSSENKHTNRKIVISYLKGDGHLDHPLGSKSRDDPLKVSQPSVEFLAALSSFGG